MLSPHGPRIQACPPPQGGRESSGSVCAPSSASWLGGTRNQVPRPQYVSRAAPGHQLVFCVHLVPSGHTLPWWAGSLLGLLPGAVLRALATSITALRPPAQSMTAWGLGGPSHAEEAVEDLPPMPPPSCILTATSRQRAHFIRRQWPSRDDMSPDPGGAGGKAQGRGPRAGPGGCRELPGRSSWPRTEGLQPTPPCGQNADTRGRARSWRQLQTTAQAVHRMMMAVHAIKQTKTQLLLQTVRGPRAQCAVCTTYVGARGWGPAAQASATRVGGE